MAALIAELKARYEMKVITPDSPRARIPIKVLILSKFEVEGMMGDLPGGRGVGTPFSPSPNQS